MPLGDWATWVASFGTVAAVTVALWQTVRQRRVENNDRREAIERQSREHAESISAWSSGDSTVHFFNASRHLAYQVAVFHVFIQGAGPATGEEWTMQRTHPAKGALVMLGALQPGSSRIDLSEIEDTPMLGRLGVEIAFTDRAGQHWIRRATGVLDSVAKGAIEHYNVGRPVDYRFAESDSRP